MPEHPPVTFAFTAGTTDSNGNLTELSGWDLSRFHKNPAVLFNHQSHLPPIGRANNLHTSGNMMFADISFAESHLGQELARLVAEDFIIGASAGWRPLEWEFLRNHENRITGIHSRRQELIEISIVGLPAHPDTLKAALALDADAQVPLELAAADELIGLITGTVPDLEISAGDPQASLLATLKTFRLSLRG